VKNLIWILRSSQDDGRVRTYLVSLCIVFARQCLQNFWISKRFCVFFLFLLVA
jgi:hypothetical protein